MRTLVLAGALALTACSTGVPTDTATPVVAPGDVPTISLRNATPHAIAYVAAGEGTLALLNIPPVLRPGELDLPRLPPGTTAPVPEGEIIGYMEGLGITFYVYRIDPVTGEGRFAGSFLATAAELDDNAGVVTVTPSRL